MSRDALHTYLTDHLSGASAGAHHAKRMRDNNQGAELADVMAGVYEEIEADREALQRVIDSLGAHQSPLKQVAGEVAERLGRLRLTDLVTGDKELSRLLELEALYLGVQGKHALWRALRHVVPSTPALASFDFDILIQRAEEQLRVIEEQRLRTAEAALSG